MRGRLFLRAGQLDSAWTSGETAVWHWSRAANLLDANSWREHDEHEFFCLSLQFVAIVIFLA